MSLGFGFRVLPGPQSYDVGIPLDPTYAPYTHMDPLAYTEGRHGHCIYDVAIPW